jgi:hypothetical protein
MIVHVHGAQVKYGVRSPSHQSLFGFLCIQLYITNWLRPRNSPPPPAFGLIYEGAIGQPR